MASGGVLPPQLTCTTPIVVSTLQLTEQVFSSLEPLSVTTLMDFPSGAMMQPACADGASHTTPVAARAASTRRIFIESPPSGETAAFVGRAEGPAGSIAGEICASYTAETNKGLRDDDVVPIQ